MYLTSSVLYEKSTNQITNWSLWGTTWSMHPNVKQVYFTISMQISFFCQSWGVYTLSLRFRFLSRDRKPLQKVMFFQESFNGVKPKCESTSCLTNRHDYITNELWRAIMRTSSISLCNTLKFSYIPAGMIRAVIFLCPALQCCCQPQYMTYVFLTSVYCVLTKSLSFLQYVLAFTVAGKFFLLTQHN